MESKYDEHDQVTSQPPDQSEAITLPPFIYGSALVIGLLISVFIAIPIMPEPFAFGLGTLLVVSSAPLVIFSMRALARVKTAIDVRKPTTSIVATGPYRFSRNPIYVAMTLLYLGIALVTNSIATLALVIPTLMVMHWGVILREEQYLERKFGEEYRAYKRRVRRWI